jgi:hypothetical protein
MDVTKHLFVFETAYFEIVVPHGYFDLLTYATCKREDDGIESTYGYELECYLKDLAATVC